MYKNAKIYKIIDNTNNDIYIGSTTQKYLSSRLSGHKKDAKNNKPCISKKIINNGDYKIVLIENYSCNSKDELLSREQYYIDNFDCINKNRAKASHKELLEQFRKSHYKNKEKRNEYSRDWKSNNKEAMKKQIEFKKSWGGDPRTYNNLSQISLDIFK